MVRDRWWLELASSVADGTTVDWARAKREAADDAQTLIQSLQILDEIGSVHRTWHRFPLETVAAPERDGELEHWGHLEIIDLIGQGSFGDVYRARDTQLERTVALKLLRPGAGDAEMAVREGRLLARVNHPNVVTVHGADRRNDRVGIWTEYVEGRTLHQLVSENGPLGAQEATLIGLDLCRALAAVHVNGILHRDVKAQNVMREEGGRIILMDFGIGTDLKDAETRSISGTPLYLAPELLESRAASVQSDLYSLGVLLYHLVTGTYPVRGATLAELRTAHHRRESKLIRELRPDLPVTFVQAVQRALAADPEQRYGSCGEMESALTVVLDREHLAAENAAESESLPGDPLIPGPREPQRRLPWLALLVAATIVLLMMTLWMIPSSRTTDPSRRTALEDESSFKIAVLPSAAQADLSIFSGWPRLVHTVLVRELARVNGVHVVQTPTGPSSASESELYDLLDPASLSYAVSSSIHADTVGYRLQVNLLDLRSREVLLSGSLASISDQNQLENAAGKLAADVANFLGIEALSSSQEYDLSPWLDPRKHTLEAVEAFIEASHYTLRGEVGAAKPLDRAIELDPDFIGARIWRISGLVNEGAISKAEAHYRYLLAIEPKANPVERIMISWAAAYLNDDFAEQTRHLNVALRYHPANDILLINLAWALFQMGNFQGAIEAIEPAAAARRHYPPLYSLWAICHIHLGELDQARKVLEKALSAKPVDPEVYGALEALAIVDGDTGARERYRTLYEARMREMQPDLAAANLGPIYQLLAAHCLEIGREDLAAELQNRTEVGLKAQARE